MPYDENKLTTVAQLKALAERTKTEIANAIEALPEEMFLDQAKTQFIPNFAFNATTYAGATNPNLDGKPVLVLAVKGIDHTNNDAVTMTYSFLNMIALTDVYTPALGNTAKVITINDYMITFHVSAEPNNAITVQNDGLHVNISGKADKVSNSTNGNLAALDANGNLVDSGIAKTNILQTSNVATDAEMTEVLTEVFGE